MIQPDNEDKAVAYIRQNTTAPIQRFLDLIVMARLEEHACHADRNSADRVQSGHVHPDRRIWAGGVLGQFRRLKNILGIRSLLRAARCIRKGQ
jgi:hypothetical protein